MKITKKRCQTIAEELNMVFHLLNKDNDVNISKLEKHVKFHVKYKYYFFKGLRQLDKVRVERKNNGPFSGGRSRSSGSC